MRKFAILICIVIIAVIFACILCKLSTNVRDTFMDRVTGCNYNKDCNYPNGRCYKLNNKCGCVCATGYSGNHCEHKITKIPNPPGVQFTSVAVNNNKQLCGITGQAGVDTWCTQSINNPKWSLLPNAGLDNIVMSNTQVCGSRMSAIYCSPLSLTNPSWSLTMNGYIGTGLSSNNKLCGLGVADGNASALNCTFDNGDVQNVPWYPNTVTVDNNGTTCGIIMNNGVATGQISCLDSKNNAIPINLPKGVIAIDVATNSKGYMCVATQINGDVGNVICTPNYTDNSEIWKPEANNLKSTSLNDNGLLCGTDIVGQVWCTNIV